VLGESRVSVTLAVLVVATYLGSNEPGAPQRQCEMKRLKSPRTIEGDGNIQRGTDNVERAKRRGAGEKGVCHPCEGVGVGVSRPFGTKTIDNQP
jgi:hypothetical protein